MEERTITLTFKALGKRVREGYDQGVLDERARVAKLERERQAIHQEKQNRAQAVHRIFGNFGDGPDPDY